MAFLKSLFQYFHKFSWLFESTFAFARVKKNVVEMVVGYEVDNLTKVGGQMSFQP